MAKDYIPVRDAEAAEWFRVFAEGIAADPAKYGLTAADAAEVAPKVQAFRDALAVSSDPRTRTVCTVAEKNEARAAATLVCRGYAQRIKVSDSIPDPDKIEIGVRPLNRHRRPVRLTEAVPLLNVVLATPTQHLLRYRDSESGSAAKPTGAVALQLFVHVGDGPAPANQLDARYCGTFTDNSVRVVHPSADGGKLATYYARWVSRRGEEGRFSLPASMHIAA